MGNSPIVYFVVLSFNRAELTIDCLNSVLNIAYPNYRVIVVDNGSDDDSVARLRAAAVDPRMELLTNDKNEGYAGGNNRGIEKALAEGAAYIFVLNNDTVVEPGLLDSLVAAFQADRRIGIAGCALEDVAYKSAHNRGQGVSLLTGRAFHYRHNQPVDGPVDVDFVCGAAIMLRARVLREIGAFDANLFFYCEDADICFRARRAGYRVCFVPGPGVRHLVGATAGAPANRALARFYSHRNRIWLIRRYGGLGHQIVFALLSFCYQYPKMFLGHILRGEFGLLWPLVKGVWNGYSGYRPYAGPSGPTRGPLIPFPDKSKCES